MAFPDNFQSKDVSIELTEGKSVERSSYNTEEYGGTTCGKAP
jgi:hypothetical protein